MANNGNDNEQINNNNDTQTRILLITHTGTIPSFQRRTADSARQLRDNFNNVIREIQPLVDTARTVNAGVQNAISITSFLNRTTTTMTHSNHNNHNSQIIITTIIIIKRIVLLSI